MEMKKNFGALITPEIEATLEELKRGIHKAPIDSETAETLKAFDESLSCIGGWESSISQREQREIDSFTEELDALLLTLSKRMNLQADQPLFLGMILSLKMNCQPP